METISQNNTLNFTTSDARIAELLKLLHEIADLGGLAALADWDQETAMPDGASENRGHQLATLQGLIHDRKTNPRIAELLNELKEAVQQPSYTDADRGLVRVTQREYDQATKLPRELVEEIERVRVQSTHAWRKAREQKNFSLFAPHLKRTVELQQEIADRFGHEGGPRYDALLDLYEPGLTTARVEELFAPVQQASTALLQRIQASGNQIDDACLHGKFSVEKQKELCYKILKNTGYDYNRGELAASAHPFTTTFGSPVDVRLTVRYNEEFMQQSLMAALHEGGHAYYEQGINPSLTRTSLANGASMGVHESQSRLWENALGRSLAFWQGQYAIVQEVFPDEYKDVSVETFMRALNKVEPSLIRVEADEVTYNLHIIIRFELEKGLVNGDISVDDLPRLWSEKYRTYLGIEPSNDAEGVLQDIHWTSGFGYFPSYTLGNLYGAQIFHTLRQAFPDLNERLAQGDTSFVLKWLQEKMYSSGATYLPDQIIRSVTGEPADPQYFVRYLNHKFLSVYGLL